MNYIMEEIANFFRYEKLGISNNTYYPFSRSEISILVVKILESYKKILSLYMILIKEKYRKISDNLIDNKFVINDYSIKEIIANDEGQKFSVKTDNTVFNSGKEEVRFVNNNEKNSNAASIDFRSAQENSSNLAKFTQVNASESEVETDKVLSVAAADLSAQASSHSPKIIRARSLDSVGTDKVSDSKNPFKLDASSFFSKKPLNSKLENPIITDYDRPTLEAKKKKLKLILEIFQNSALFVNKEALRSDMLKLIQYFTSKKLENTIDFNYEIYLLLLACIASIQTYRQNIMEIIKKLEGNVTPKKTRGFLSIFFKDNDTPKDSKNFFFQLLIKEADAIKENAIKENKKNFNELVKYFELAQQTIVNLLGGFFTIRMFVKECKVENNSIVLSDKLKFELRARRDFIPENGEFSLIVGILKKFSIAELLLEGSVTRKAIQDAAEIIEKVKTEKVWVELVNGGYLTKEHFSYKLPVENILGQITSVESILEQISSDNGLDNKELK